MSKNHKSAEQQVNLLTVRDIAELDRVSEKTVRRAIDAGLLVALRVGVGGRLLRIHPDAHRTYRNAGAK